MSLICIEKYTATKKDFREYPARPEILFCDVTRRLLKDVHVELKNWLTKTYNPSIVTH